MAKSKTGIKEAFDKLEYNNSEDNYPQNSFFKGLEAPSRFEAEVYNCIIRGTIPPQIDGTFYRVMPDTVWAPRCEDDIFINGDGAIDAVRIRDGHADFKQRYVRSQKFLVERAARKALFGQWRNIWTDDPRVRHMDHASGNTHVVLYDKQLLAMKEDGLPYAMDPDTLETKAHPKIDPSTGELITMGYAAKGEGSPDVAYYLFDKHGKKLEECWFQAPYVGVMHDIAATDKWIIFTLNPLANVPEDLLKAGHKVYGWDETKSLCLGILPRRNPKPEMVKWFEYKNAFVGHTSNAFDGEDGCIYFDAPVTNYNLFWFFPPIGQDMASAPSSKPPKDGALSHLMRFKLDPNSTEKTLKPTVLVDVDGELPRIDSRYETKPYKYVFIAMHDPNTDDAPVGGAFNSLAKANVEDGTYEYWSAGKDVALGEVAFVARSKDAPEGDGYALSVVNRRDTMLSQVVVVDTAKMAEGPVAIIELPFRLRSGIHGTWVMADELATDKDLCDMTGVTDEMRKEFGKPSLNRMVGINGTNSTNGNTH
ncbi:hypothetical protein SLS64_013716 [Diaporthe eres]|uniref:Carotenoid oxygenase n=1 Tax=Diaporthe eres TaxID=83184 RepID=A0ABR1PCC4_DIAER